jgi:6-phosphogluconolactonase
MTELIVAPTPSELARPAAEWLELEMTTAIAARGACALSLAGGHTPEPIYRAMASASNIDWTKVDVFFGDERAVPPDHPHSNYLMVSRILLSRVPVPAGQVHRMEAERGDREVAAREYERGLPPRLDILLLGMGPDGHTASLFPGSAALDERRRLVLPVVGPKPPAERLTITPPVIEAARLVVVIATGGDKAAMVARAIEGPLAPKEVPAQLARRGTWFLDRAAAAGLTTRSVAP